MCSGSARIWDEKGLLVGKCPHRPRPRSTGRRRSRRSWRRWCPAGSTTTRSSPVEGEGSCKDGTRDGHWSESVLGNELMTGFLIGRLQPAQRHHQRVAARLGLRGQRRAERPLYRALRAAAALRTGAAAADRLHELHVPDADHRHGQPRQDDAGHRSLTAARSADGNKKAPGITPGRLLRCRVLSGCYRSSSASAPTSGPARPRRLPPPEAAAAARSPPAAPCSISAYR